MTGRRRKRHTRRWLLLGAATVAVVVAAIFGWQAVTAAAALDDARTQADALAGNLRAGHLAAARLTATSLEASASRAHDRTDGPLWWVAARVPVVGSTVRAVQVSASSLDLVAREAVPAALRVTSAMRSGAFRPRHGRISLRPLEELRRPAARASRALAQASAALDSVPAAAVRAPVHDRFVHLQASMASLDSAAAAASTSLRLLPGMLGADGPRTWLLLVQNNAEIRATGGMPGSWAVLRAAHGHIRMTRQGADTDMLPPLARPPVPLPASVKALYGDSLGTDFRDVNFDPSFPQVARMAAGIAQARVGVHVDGVVAVDPVALSHVLAGTGPVPVSFGGQRTVLTAGNVVPILLNRVYRTIPDGTVQNDFFDTAARAVFTSVTRGRGDPVAVTRGLVTAASRGRVLVWSARRGEEALLDRTRVSGELPSGSTGTPQVGVYLSDATATKMEYYLRVRSSVQSSSCSTSGVQQLRSRTVLRSVAPADAASLPPSVTGPGTHAPLGSMRLNAWVYGPTAGAITSIRVDGRPATLAANRQQDRQVTSVPVLLRPGQQVVVTTTMRSGRHQRLDPVLTSTPTAEAVPSQVSGTSACG